MTLAIFFDTLPSMGYNPHMLYEKHGEGSQDTFGSLAKNNRRAIHYPSAQPRLLVTGGAFLSLP